MAIRAERLTVENLAAFEGVVLDHHLRDLIQSQPAWFTGPHSDEFAARWRSSGQPEGFLTGLARSLEDDRTLAEIWLDDDDPIGFMWLQFIEVDGLDPYQGRGIGAAMLSKAEQHARQTGATVLRGDTGAQNQRARRAIEQAGGFPAQITYEKLL